MTQPTCQVCSRQCQTFLCTNCERELRDMLEGLAKRWLRYLQDAALGQTRLGDVVRHRRGDEQPLRLNLRASELLDYTRSVLVEWIRDLCETRGVPVPHITVTAEMALWLARNVSAIAADQGAKVCYREIRQIVGDIERVINRPVPWLPLGPCPTETGRRERCNYRLEAPRGAKRVKCPQCEQTHEVGRLIETLICETEDYLFTMSELVGIILPAVREYVPRRTLQHWAAHGKLQPHDYTTSGEPKYLLADVRRLRDEKPQTAKTGAAAKKYKAAG